jgi:hypothetical protein
MSRYKDHPIYGGSPSTGESVVLTRPCLNPALVAGYVWQPIFELGDFELWSFDHDLPL